MNNLKKIRTERNITLRDLSEKVHIDYTALCRVENGKRNLTDSDIAILCKFFNVSSDYLLGLSDFKKNTIENKPHPLNDFQFALHNLDGELTADDKETILDLAQKLVNKNKKISN